MSSVLPIAGAGWAPLAARVDALVTEWIRTRDLPGMTVAVTLQGRLILSRGYGFANVATRAAMLPDSRSRIGSVTKAVITGPAGDQLMRERGIDPATTRLYGPGGVFGQRYDLDIQIAATRFTPVAAIAVDLDGRVVAWYTNGRYSVGDARVLDRHAGLAPYALPAGKTPDDIRSIAFARDGRTHTWYDDGTHSTGTVARLGDLTVIDEKPARVGFPPGYAMQDVVGIGIDKATDDVVAWYDDGTFSVGSTLDFDARAAPAGYRVADWPAGGARDIRDVDLAPDGRAHAWFRNGSASVGTRDDLAAHELPFKYGLPTFSPGSAPDDRAAWYREITIQHLLDHAAGFERSGDGERVARYFGQPRARMTYEHGHQHFLQTRKLRFRPGAATSYSNHGFGMWFLLVPALTRGELSFRDYVWSHYLEPMGLRDDVVPMRATPDERDAAPHECGSAGCRPLPFEEATEALAAGEYTASAEDLARIMKILADRHPPEALDRMGWGRSPDGRLSHSGLIRGGASHVTIFPAGHRTEAGVDLGRIHVALATNAGDAEAGLAALALQIALVVPESAVPPDYDQGSSPPTA